MLKDISRPTACRFRTSYCIDMQRGFIRTLLLITILIQFLGVSIYGWKTYFTLSSLGEPISISAEAVSAASMQQNLLDIRQGFTQWLGLHLILLLPSALLLFVFPYCWVCRKTPTDLPTHKLVKGAICMPLCGVIFALFFCVLFSKVVSELRRIHVLSSPYAWALDITPEGLTIPLSVTAQYLFPEELRSSRCKCPLNRYMVKRNVAQILVPWGNIVKFTTQSAVSSMGKRDAQRADKYILKLKEPIGDTKEISINRRMFKKNEAKILSEIKQHLPVPLEEMDAVR